jgi:hypothetical protein
MDGGNLFRFFAVVVGDLVHRARFLAGHHRIDHDDTVRPLQFGQSIKDRRADIQHGDPFGQVRFQESLGGMNPDALVGKQKVPDTQDQQPFARLCPHQCLGFTDTTRARLFGLITCTAQDRHGS